MNLLAHLPLKKSVPASATPALAPLLLSPLVSLGLTLGSAIAVSAQGIELNVQPFQTRTTTSPVAAGTTQARKSVWGAVDVADGGFKILMPGEVDRKVHTLEVNGKAVEQTLLLATQAKHDSFYMVAWSDLSVGNALNEAEQTKVLESTKTSFLRSFKGQLTQQIKFKLAGNNGMQYIMNSHVRGNPVTITSRSYLVGSRLYHVLAAIPKRVEPNLKGSTQGFLKSFQLRPIERDIAQLKVPNPAQETIQAASIQGTKALPTPPQ